MWSATLANDCLDFLLAFNFGCRLTECHLVSVRAVMVVGGGEDEMRLGVGSHACLLEPATATTTTYNRQA